ncbi:MAG: amidase, partial [Gemmatimonadetes bacterium]|nr:amidase [Gemmatimonadota bacterium]
VELQAAMESGTVTSAQLVQSYLARIAAFDQAGPALNAILQLNPDALAEARALDQERALRGPRSPLHGIPVLVKDNFDVAGLPTTGGSVALQDLVPHEDSWLVARMRDAGAIVLAKTNMHEFAFGITTTSSLGGQTRNPYDLTRNPGGSSGGTAVGVTASFAPVGWGTDTCGSVRIPAAYNGLLGLRPTQGLLSTSGVLPLSHTLDTPGPMARAAMDLAVAMDAVLGPGGPGRAGRSSDLAAPAFVAALQDDALVGVRIGVLGDHLDGAWTIGEVLAELGRTLPSGTAVAPTDLLRATSEGSGEGLEVGQAARGALERMEAMGAELIEIRLGDMDAFLVGEDVIDLEFERDLQAYLLAAPAAPLRSLDDILRLGVHDPSIEDVLIRRNKAASASPVEYRDALARLAATREELLQVFERDRLDAIAYPTMRRPPAEIGQNQWGSMCLLSASTGFPAITIPVGLGPGGLPVGLELLARPGEDARLVAFAYAFEKAHQQRIAPGTTPPLMHWTP